MKNGIIFLAGIFLTLQLSAQTGGGFVPGSFLPRTDITTGNFPHSVVAADFNGDGKPDLFVARGSAGNVTILTNASSDGTIRFANSIDLPGSRIDMEGSAVGDLDGDGKPDVVVTNGVGDSSVSVFRNTSTSVISFAAKIDFPTNNGPYAVAIGDLDGDGKPDLAIANTGSNTITLYKNNSTPGYISFIRRMDLPVGTNPYGIAIGDLDKDGKADLVVSTEGSSNALYIIRNISAPDNFLFEAPVSYAALNGAFTLAIGDLDGDGSPDIAATGGYPNAILTVRNISLPGSLAFAAPMNFETGNYMVDVAIRDLDQDGKPELITVNRFANSVSVLKNKSSSGSIDFEGHIDYGVGEQPFFAAIADLDGDGRPDIISANSSSDKISILKNLVGDTLAPQIISFTPKEGINGTTIKILGKNFTGVSSVQFGGTDALLFTVDSATGITASVGAGASGNLTIATNFGTATDSGFIYKGLHMYGFTPANGITGDTIQIFGKNFIGITGVTFGGVPASSFLVESDTSLEAILGNGASGDIRIVSANGNDSLSGFGYGGRPVIVSVSPLMGTIGSTVIIRGNNFSNSPDSNIVFFGPVRAIVKTASSSQLQVVVPAGVCYDPVSVTANYLTAYSSGFFSVNSPDGDSILSVQSFTPAGNFNTGNYPVSVSVSDLDGDGKPDLITANSLANSISVLQNTSSSGIFSFKPKQDLTTGTDPKNIAVGDLNGDGKPDIVVTDFNSGLAGYISVFENTSHDGIISFAPKSDISTGNGSMGVAIADMDRDGKPDIIVTSGNSAQFSILKNTSAGSISFAPKQDYYSVNHPDHISVADLDNDGYPDIIINEFSNSSISVFRNRTLDGPISLELSATYPVGQNPGFLRVGDLDGDGKLDLVVENYGSGSITMYQNQSTTGSILLGNRLDSAIAASSIAIADLNGDGKLDISVGRFQSGNITALQNTGTGTGFVLSSPLDFTTGNFDVFGNVGDLDGDGRPDLVAANVLLNTVTVLKNNTGSPVISSISDTAAIRGKSIEILGRRLTAATEIRFGDEPASSFQVISSTQIHAVVGGGASGSVRVSTPSGKDSLPGFRFIPEIRYEGSTSFCKNNFLLLQSTADLNNQWYKDSVMIDGGTDNILKVATAGIYSVKTTSHGMATSSDSGISVSVMNVSIPSISKNADNVLVSSIAEGNQWYFNGTMIPGATKINCLPEKNGLYTVTHFENGCTSDLSGPFNVQLIDAIDLGNGQSVRLYPNPVTTNLTIKWDIQDFASLNISISDLQGKPAILKTDFQQNGTTIDLSNLEPGYYLLRIYNPQSNINKTIKIFKAN